MHLLQVTNARTLQPWHYVRLERSALEEPPRAQTVLLASGGFHDVLLSSFIAICCINVSCETCYLRGGGGSALNPP